MNLVMRKPKTTWQRRKEKILQTWMIFKESKPGLVGLAILIFLLMIILLV